MKLSSIPVIKLPIVDVTTDPLDLLVAGLALRMKQLSRTHPKFIELIHEKSIRLQIGTQSGFARQIVIHEGGVETVSGQDQTADLAITFTDSEQGVKTLLKGDPTALMMGIQEGTIKVEGDYSLLMWFNRVAKLIPPHVPKSVQEKVKLARQFVKEKIGK